MKIVHCLSPVFVGCVFVLASGTGIVEGTMSETVVVDANAFATSNQGIWSTLMNISFDPAQIISSQSKIKVPSAEHRLLEFGDYAEGLPFDCPATTTCPVVCVANVTDCPTVCIDGFSLCASGHCSADCTVFDTYENPCGCEALPVTCPKVVDLFDVCFLRFEDPYYINNAACLELQEESLTLLSWTGPWFLACYIIFAVVTALLVGWCFLNQKVFPVSTSTKPLLPSDRHSNSNWTQTGYKRHLIGTLIYILVNCVIIAIQLLLFYLVIMYYVQQGGITRFPIHFESDIQVLKAFQVVWMVGLAWCLILRYPDTGIYNLLLRRCDLKEATHVAVVAPLKTVEDATLVPSVFSQTAAAMWFPFEFALRIVFSYPYGIPGWNTTFCPVSTDAETGTKSILHRMRRYIYDESTGAYVPFTINVGTTCGELMDRVSGLSLEEFSKLRGTAGPNVIPLKKPSYAGSFIKEVSKTFYLYQNFIVWAFANFYYWYMAIVYTLVRLCGAVAVSYFQYVSDSMLYKLSSVEGEIQVLRDGLYQTIPVQGVVPGDVVVLKKGIVFCDMVILKGDNILLDESALTGESTPVLKMALNAVVRDVSYSRKEHKTNSILAGTEILEIDEEESNLGLVMTTGSFTGKGELLSEVLSYERHKFKFDDDVKLVLLILMMEAVVLVSLVFIFLDDNWVYSWFYGLYVLGTCIPPLLPTVFVVSVGISANRLQLKRIACTYPEGILVAGKVDAAFFDKTGTLTKQGLDFLSVDASSSSEELLFLAMAVCHTLGTISDGTLVGNQVDLISFESSSALLHQEKGAPTRVTFRGKNYKILKHFEFDCHRTTQSVVVEDDQGVKRIFVKGSAESIQRICNPSTIPGTFDQTVQESAKTGIYQIAVATRTFDIDVSVSDAKRDDIETSLNFAGFVSFQNLLREETPGVLQELEDGDIMSTMITGDSVLTGICIARQAGMIKENKTVLLGRRKAESEIEWINFDNDAIVSKPSVASLELSHSEVDLALTGEAWAILLETDPKYASMISKHVRVFGRCKPGDKVSVVATFVANGYKTLMCGDGQNDCGSLKTAHVGVALSTAEASLVAPFTSLEKSITSVTEVLREGRCALASALASYSYYIIYGQTETLLQVIAAYFAVTFTEWCWVFYDGIWSITMAFSLPLSKAAGRLTPRQPTDSLLGPETMLSVCGILAWNFLFLIFALIALWNQDWFACRMWNSEDVSNVLTIGDNYETEVLFIIGAFQYISSAMVLNFGYTFRQGWCRNYIFVLLSTTWMIFVIVMTLYPSSFSCIWRVNCENENAVRWVTSSIPVAINNAFNTTLMPTKFRWILVIIMTANFITITVWQYFFINGYLVNKLEAVAKKQPHKKSGMEESTMARSNAESGADIA